MENNAQDIYALITGGTTSVIAIIVLLICVVGWWKLFEKAGFAGILSLIPIVNIFVLSKIAYGSYGYALLMIIPFINVIYSLALNYQIMRRFGCEKILCILGAFFPVLVLLPAFGTNRYLGPKH